MDPLSLTASIIAVLGAGGTIAKGLSKIRRLKSAPDILLQLNNEVTDLHLLIRAVNELYHRPTNLNPTSTLQEKVVCNALERAKYAVLELEKLIEYVLTKQTARGTEVDTLAWSRVLDRVKEAKNNIRTARTDLNTIWTTLDNRRVSTRIELELQGMSTTVADLESNSLNMQNVLDRTAEAVIRLSQTVQEETQRSLERTTQLEADRLMDKSRTFPITGGLGGIRNLPAKRDGSPSMVLELTQLRKCEPYCICCCHTQRNLQTAPYLANILGVLFTGYIGVPGLFASCDVATCRVRSPARIHIFYIFPRWFLEMAVLVRVELSRAKGPELLIRCLRVCEVQTTPSFQAIAHGQYDQIKSLLSMGKASMLDVTEAGRSLLHVSTIIFVRNPKVRDSYIRSIKLFLQEGADLFQEDQFMGTPYLELLMFSIKERTIIRTYPFLESVLSQGDPSETLGFSELHSLVVCTDCLNSFKSRLILISRDMINHKDRTGRTPLSWAAELGKNDEMILLLMKGANPNIADRRGQTPLLYCAHDAICITTLLKSGAHVDHVDKLGNTKLMRLFLCGDDTRCVDILRRFGTNINHRTVSESVIHLTVQRSRPRILKWLLERDVNLEVPDSVGDTALLSLLRNSQGEYADTLEMIVQKNPNYKAMNNLGEGLLHSVARFGSFQYISILTGWSDLSDLDVDQKNTRGLRQFQKNSHGNTAMELAEWRRDYQSDWALDSQMDLDPDPEAYFAAFKSWIESIRAAYIAKMSNSAELHAESSGRYVLSSGDDIDSEADHRLRLRIPGSYPSEESDRHSQGTLHGGPFIS